MLPSAEPDGERILTWEQVYDLDELPDAADRGRLRRHRRRVRQRLPRARRRGRPWSPRRDRVLPGEDADAAEVLEDVLHPPRHDTCCRSSRMAVGRRATATRSTVTLTDGRTVEGSHCLLARRLGAQHRRPRPRGGRRGRSTTAASSTSTGSRAPRPAGVYAAGDCTGVLMLASVAAMQGRIAMWHFLGDAVAPLDLKTVSSNVFTAPEIATVGWSQQAGRRRRDRGARSSSCRWPATPRAKMQGVRDGFVKLFCRPGTGIVVGGVVVAPRASELIHPVSIAVAESLTADQLAHAFTVYPSMSGSIAEAARRLHHRPA